MFYILKLLGVLRYKFEINIFYWCDFYGILRWKSSKVSSFFYFRIDKDTEVRGLDIKKHGEPAYPTAAYGHGWDNEGDLDMKSKFIIIWNIIF